MSTVTTEVRTSVASTPAAHSAGERSPQSEQHHVTWADGTVDNEHAGKKKSKKCCIFKKRMEFGESSSEEDSDEEPCDHTACKPSQHHN